MYVELDDYAGCFEFWLIISPFDKMMIVSELHGQPSYDTGFKKTTIGYM